MGFAGAEADEDFEAAIFEVALEWDEGAGTAFFDLAKQAVNLSFVKEELAGAIGFRVGAIAMTIGGDVKGVEPGFPVFNPPKGMSEVTPAGADGFNFRTSQDKSSLERFQNGVVMASAAVVDLDHFQGA